MSALCLLDTSIFLEILNVPGHNEHQAEIVKEFRKKIKSGERIFLPMAAILETGNKIAQISDGNRRRTLATTFIKKVEEAIEGNSPFHPVDFLNTERFKKWLGKFSDSAMRGIGLCDLSIIQDYEKLCVMNTGKKVYIWSLDTHLQSYGRDACIA